MTAAEEVLASLDATSAWQEVLYRDLHAHPELSTQEHATAAKAAGRLRDWGYQVHEGIGGTGVVGVLANGPGKTVLARADMDALPVKEATGLPYASTVTALDLRGEEVPVMHACGHDVHVVCLLGAAQLLADARDAWTGTMVAVFQPDEELIGGARAMVEDGLVARIPRPDVALAQHVLPVAAGTVGTRPGPLLSSADSIHVTVHGRGAHGSMPQNAVDPVVLAAHIVVRLQTIVSREVAPDEFAVVTVGGLSAGTAGNVIPDLAELWIDVRAYDPQVRRRVLDAVERTVEAECRASGAPQPPRFEYSLACPATVNDEEVTAVVAGAFKERFGPNAVQLERLMPSEDFGFLADAFGVPYTYWGFGGVDPERYATAVAAGRVSSDIPVSHSPDFAPVIQPTLRTGTEAVVVAALAFLGRP